jgi:hypothetical protein
MMRNTISELKMDAERRHQHFFSIREDDGLLHEISEQREQNQQQQYPERQVSTTMLTSVFLISITALMTVLPMPLYADSYATKHQNHHLRHRNDVQPEDNTDSNYSYGISLGSMLLCNGVHLGASLLGGPLAGFAAAVILPCS